MGPDPVKFSCFLTSWDFLGESYGMESFPGSVYDIEQNMNLDVGQCLAVIPSI